MGVPSFSSIGVGGRVKGIGDRIEGGGGNGAFGYGKHNCFMFETF